jgi:hypothetical protein
MAALRPRDCTNLMEASQARLAASRRLCLSTAILIQETRVTIERTLERLDTRSQIDAATERKL